MKERDDEEIETVRDFILTKLCYSAQCAVACATLIVVNASHRILDIMHMTYLY